MADLGNLGESELESWCHSTDLIVNKSLISDKAGWDHIIDFPYGVDISQGEVHASAYQCKIQVKATQKKNKKIQIKLSNLRRMATDPIPNFILFLEYDNNFQFETAYLLYIDKTLIKRIIERVHTLTITAKASKQELKLHAKNMTIKFEPLHLLTSPSGITFKTKIIEYIGKDFQKCVVSKKEYLERVGFDGSPNRMAFSTFGKGNFEKLIDISLGKDDSVEISQLKTFKKRFGQDYDIEEISQSGGRLSMPNLEPSTHGTVTFKSHPLKAGFTFDVGLFITPLISDINHELFSYRLKSDFFDLTARPAKSEMKFNFSLNNVEMEILKFHDAVLFLQQLSNGETFDVSMTFENDKSTLGKVSGNSALIAVEEELELIKNAISILNYLDINTSVIVDLNELFKYEGSINPLSAFIDRNNKSNFQVTFDLIDVELDLCKKVASIGTLNTRIGKHICSFVYVLIGFPSFVNNRYEISGNDYVIEEKLIYCVDDEVPVKIFEEIFKKVEDKYESDYPVVNTHR